MSILRAQGAWPQGIWHTGYDVLCHVGWAVTKIIPLPPGPSIVPLQRAEPTLGSPLKCLFGPVAGDLHLTDMMRKGKGTCADCLLWVCISVSVARGFSPVLALGKQEGCRGCPPCAPQPQLCSTRHRSSPGVPGLLCQAKTEPRGNARASAKPSLFPDTSSTPWHL